MKSYRGARIYQCEVEGSGTVKAAVAVFDNDLDIIPYPKLTTNNIVVVGIRTRAWEIAVASYYFEPDQPIGPYLDQLTKIKLELGTKNLLIGGDANAKNTWWGSTTEDSRGEEMHGTLEELELQILNTGDMPTFYTVRGGIVYKSHVDVTACSLELIDLVDGWRIDAGVTSSDHNTILLYIKLKRDKGISITRTTRKYNTKKANWENFESKLGEYKIENNISLNYINGIANKEELEKLVNEYKNAIEKACDEAIPKSKNKVKITIPWWSEDLAVKKKEVSRKKNRIRNAAPVRRAMVVEDYTKEKEEYECLAKKAQTTSWKAFCEKQEGESMWEGIYRVIRRTTRRQEDLTLSSNGAFLNPKESAALLADTFYPRDREEEDDAEHRLTREVARRVNEWHHGEYHDPPFTPLELKTAVAQFNPKKAPGVDGFTSDICSRAICQDPDAFLALYNKCLELAHFPNIWKEATVVVLRKPGKEDYTNPKSYRPIGLLPVLGKVLERMVVARLKWQLVPRLSTRQFGFMPQRSTEDALYTLIKHVQDKLRLKKLMVLVSLDIEGAFDSAWWPAIKVRLAEEECPVNIRRLLDSYLEGRKVSVRYAGEESTRETNKGCVQGSIGGPILWNLLLDPLLHKMEESGYFIQAFADDIVLVVDGDTAAEVSRSANAALARVHGWGVRNKLRFAPHKTCAMLITNKLKYDTPALTMAGVDIGMVRSMKLLGVTIDDKLTFNDHVKNICKKAAEIYKQLARAAKVSWGLNRDIVHVIYTATIEPIVTYAAGAWAPATKKLGIRRRLGSVQRGFVQKLCKSYRTVSLNSALVLAGILPLDLRIQEAAALYEARRGSSQFVPGDREIECMVRFAETSHPAKQMALEFIRLEDQQLVNNQNEQAVRIFTDGSKIEGKVGAALSLWDSEGEVQNFKLTLAAYCTVYQAELLAICKATDVILKRNETTYGLYSDSMSALQTLAGHGSLHPLAVRARANIALALEQKKVVSFFWVKAHAGLPGNERADELAKEAALSSRRKPDYDQCPVSFIKRQIRMGSLDEWNRRYVSGETASVTRMFLPDAIAAYHVIRHVRPTGILTQILTGHGGFSEYLNRFKCKESSSCTCDPSVSESIPHILIECPIFAIERYNIEQELNIILKREEIGDIMLGKNREKFLNYCQKIAQKVISKNKK